MHGRSLPIIAIVLLLFTAPESGPAQVALPVSGRVTRVFDGDTIEVRTPDRLWHRVRLIGVDAPEWDDTREDVRFWAAMSTRYATHSLLNHEVGLTYEGQTHDRYGRLLAHIWLEDDSLFNERLVQDGFGVALLTFPFNKGFQERFLRAMEEARKGGRGLWQAQDPQPVDPRDAQNRVGQYVAVRFRCLRASEGRKYAFLYSPDKAFEALVSRQCLPKTASPTDLEGRELVVRGILERGHGRLRMYVIFPRQIALPAGLMDKGRHTNRRR